MLGTEIVQNQTVVSMDDLEKDPTLVREVQSRLRDLGVLQSADVDGDLGARTRTAMQTFCNFVHLDNMTTHRFGPTFFRRLYDTRSIGHAVPVSPGDPQASAFDTALKFTLKWEGGFVNHPADPGGRTNMGITQRVYDRYRMDQGLATADVKDITRDEVHDIYFTRYWQPSHAADMVAPLAVAHFDTAVNFGVTGAVEFLQEALGLHPDGVFGRQTQTAFLQHNDKDIAIKIARGRIAYRHQRVHESPSQQVFLNGWLARDNDLLSEVQKLS